jgi:exonuclease SbcD
MRIAHLADPHLGFRRFHRLTERGHNQREVDVAQAFARAIDGVIAEAPDAIIVAGDLFESVRPTNSAILAAFRQFARLRSALPDTPVVLIAGNHDTPRSTDTVSIFGLFNDLGIKVAHLDAQRFVFPELGLSVLAVPHQALFATPRPAMEPAGPEPFQVLVLHGETPGLFGEHRTIEEPGGAHLSELDIAGGKWNYVALGHYHVQHQVRERVWYAGSLDYVSTDPWGELRIEREERIAGKGWLLVDLESGKVERRPIEAPRKVIDLKWLDATDLSSNELDRLLAEAVQQVKGGIDGAVVRQVVRNVPRTTARELNHAAIREWKARALHFQLDLRRPEPGERDSFSGAPGGRRTLADELEGFLKSRELPPGIDRQQFVTDGMAFLHDVEREATEG